MSHPLTKKFLIANILGTYIYTYFLSEAYIIDFSIILKASDQIKDDESHLIMRSLRMLKDLYNDASSLPHAYNILTKRD